MRRLAARAAFVGLALGAWQVASSLATSRVLLPPPADVLAWVGRAAADGTLAASALVTLRRLAVGYLLGLAVGLPLGVLCARWRIAEDTVGLAAVGVQSLPSVCWAPLAMLWFGANERAMLFIVLMGTVGSIVLATAHGIRSVPSIYARAARTMGSKGLHTWTSVIVPASMPAVVAGMKQAWAFAWRSLMAAEIYVVVAGHAGLGLLLHYGREFHAMDQVLGVILLIVTLGVAFDRLLFAPVEAALHRRWGTGRTP